MKHNITRSQRNALNRIVRFYRERNAHTKCTSVRARIEETRYGKVWVWIETRRSDCERGSAKAAVCRQAAHILVGNRGGIEVYYASADMNEEKDHIAKMLRGTAKKI